MNKIISILIVVLLFVGIGYLVVSSPKSTDTSINNVEIKDGTQYITINAKGGYSPKVSNAKAGIPTKLIVKTNGTFDCSASLVIRAVDFKKILPQSGETEIDLGTPKVGELQGLCSMGMYNFLVNFS